MPSTEAKVCVSARVLLIAHSSGNTVHKFNGLSFKVQVSLVHVSCLCLPVFFLLLSGSLQGAFSCEPFFASSLCCFPLSLDLLLTVHSLALSPSAIRFLWQFLLSIEPCIAWTLGHCYCICSREAGTRNANVLWVKGCPAAH